jgi:hypothetical protein
MFLELEQATDLKAECKKDGNLRLTGWGFQELMPTSVPFSPTKESIQER